MKRVFETAGFSFIFSLAILNNLPAEKAFYFLCIASVLSVILIFIKPFKRKKEVLCFLLSCTVSALSYLAVTQFIYKSSLEIADKNCEITAAVTDTPSISSGGNFSYHIKTKEINGEKRKTEMMLYTPYDISAEPYDEITFTAYPFVLGDNNEATLKYFKGKRLYVGAYTKYDVKVYEPDKKPFYAFFSMRKAESEENIRKHLDGDYAEFAISLLFGDKTYLSPERKDSFRVSGLSHIMAVSGLHISVWIMGLYFVLKRLSIDDKFSGAMCIFASVCLMFFCGFSVSVVRAGVMIIIYFSASFFKRKGDSLNSLGFAASGICLINPYALYDASFLLSFFATLGIIVFSDIFPFFFKKQEVRKLSKRLLRYLSGTALICVSAGIFTLPVMIKFFSQVNIFSVIGNIAVSFLITPCLVLSGMLSLFPNVNFFSSAVSRVLFCVEKYIFFAVDKISLLPFASVGSDNTFFKIIIPSAVTVMTLILISIRKKKISFSSLIISAATLIITLS